MWADEFVDERDARFINDQVHANIQRDGTFSVVPQMKGGVTSSSQLRRIADVADKYSIPMIKLTGGQRIDLLGVRKEDLPAVWGDLDMPSGYAYGKSFRTVKTCVEVTSVATASAIPPPLASRWRSATRAWRARPRSSPSPVALATAPRLCARISAWSPWTAADGRCTSAAQPAHTSARVICSPRSTAPPR
jgi:sulfite reductase beta subunit-like hemoprotein